MILPINGIYQSNMKLSFMGLEFQPSSNIQLISTQTIQTKILCSASCNQLSSCRTFDYDLVSKRCRLFVADSTTGSIVSSSSSTSVVGTVDITAGLYSSLYNQPCQICQQNRYAICSTNTSLWQCPMHTYWDGSVCALQGFENDTCGQSNACRSDFNLSCTSTVCYTEFQKCSIPVPISKHTIFSYIK
jgi:hypothetical protein